MICPKGTAAVTLAPAQEPVNSSQPGEPEHGNPVDPPRTGAHPHTEEAAVFGAAPNGVFKPHPGRFYRDPMTDQAATTAHLEPPAPVTAVPAGPARSSGGADTRVRIVEAAISVFRRYAFHTATFDIVAATAGLSVAEVTHAFPTWESLVVATIDRWNNQRMRPIMPLAEHHGTVVFLRGIVRANVDDPALMRFLSATANIAATPNHPMAPFLHQEWARFHVLIIRQLEKDIQAGREPDTMQPVRGAEQLIALYEGLQLQSMVRPGMDLLDAYDRAVTRLRDGWARTYTPPVWNLDR
jgi:AcrR family transcriptional regulator